jgi:hypothetical protein
MKPNKEGTIESPCRTCKRPGKKCRKKCKRLQALQDHFLKYHLDRSAVDPADVDGYSLYFE